MKSMIKVLMFIAFVLSQGVAWADSMWMDNFEEAKAKAKAENRFMVLDFTGSDWCGWCIKLDKEVFDTSDFKLYAAKNLVLVELDFPRRKKLSNDLQKQNYELQKKYGITGYPTIIVLDPNGEQVGRTGYQKGGPKKYVEHLQEIIKPHSSRFGGVVASENEKTEAPSATEMRTWTATSGSTVEATYYRMIGNTVELRKDNGRTMKIGLPSLSEDDQAFLRSIKAIR